MTNHNVRCVGMIMDGNRRWAKDRGLPTLEGHRKGHDKLEEVMDWVKAHKIEHVVVYAFSTENWNRSEEEVAYLMDLFRFALKRWKRKAVKEKLRIRFIGQTERFAEDIQKLMTHLEEETKQFLEASLSIALSYGGKAEIVQAAQKVCQQGEEVTEESITKNMWTKGIPSPDIIIRTGGERRLSNFLTWQSVYSELFFIDSYWPAFSKKEFDEIMDDYKKRQRRFGR